MYEWILIIDMMKASEQVPMANKSACVSAMVRVEKATSNEAFCISKADGYLITYNGSEVQIYNQGETK